MEYRAKQIGDIFYPQYKKIFGWKYYKGKSYMNYGVSSFLTTEKDCVYYENLYFNSLNDANNFLIKEKESDTITYHHNKIN